MIFFATKKRLLVTMKTTDLCFAVLKAIIIVKEVLGGVVHQHYTFNVTRFEATITTINRDITSRISFLQEYLGEPAKTIKLIGHDVRIF